MSLGSTTLLINQHSGNRRLLPNGKEDSLSLSLLGCVDATEAEEEEEKEEGDEEYLSGGGSKIGEQDEKRFQWKIDEKKAVRMRKNASIY